jgi:hypothetical protein
MNTYARLTDALPERGVVESVTVPSKGSRDHKVNSSIRTADLWNKADDGMARAATFDRSNGLSRERFLFDGEGEFPASTCVMNEIHGKLYQAASYLDISGNSIFPWGARNSEPGVQDSSLSKLHSSG